ncbi:hypothetical protein BBP40_008416 [Aspergillus hancockii]|nr:hypothetical protein BBP40_008416 [Aspergillus hancockii]
MSHDNTMQKVEEICYDLERRCDRVEAPLRAVEDERNKIFLEAEKLKRHNDELESELQRASSTIAELQQNISRLEIHSETASTRIEELTASFKAAQREFEDQHRDSQEAATKERENARTRELDLIASVAEKEEQLDQLQEESYRQREENNILRQTLDAVSQERDVAVERNASFEQDIARLGGSVEDNRMLIIRKNEEIERLQAAKEDMEALMEIIQSKVGSSILIEAYRRVAEPDLQLNEEVSESENVRCAHREAEARFKTEVASLREQFELRLSKSTAECTEQKEEIATLQGAIQAAASTAAKDLQTKEKRLQYLEKKVQHLRDERAAKTREFSEAQQHIGRLITVMGWKPDTADSKTPGEQPWSTSALEPSQAATMQKQTRPPEEIQEYRFSCS